MKDSLRRICRPFTALLLSLSLLTLLSSPAFASDFWSWDSDEKVEEIDGIPTYWMDELEQGAKDINLALMEAGSRKAAFLFYSDTHWNYSSQRSPALLKYLYDHTGMTKTIFGGDIIWDEGPNYDDVSYVWEWRSQVKELPNHHSVVGNHDDGNTKAYTYEEDFVYGYLLAPEETSDIVRADHGLCYYIDVPVEKTRYLYLDTAAVPIMYDPVQAQFLLDSLASTAEGWHIVVVAHIWYTVDYDNEFDSNMLLTDQGRLVLELLDAYNSRSSGIARVCKSTTDYSAVKLPYDFSQSVGKVEFCIGGHIHQDYDATSAQGIPVIHVDTDSYNTRSGLSAVAGTTNESCINGVIADYDARKVTIVRIGRGESRIVPLQ